MRPFIGLTSDWREPPLYAPAANVCVNFLDGIIRAGGFPVLLSPVMKDDFIDEALHALSGVIVVGGPDLHPEILNENAHPMSQPMNTIRQEFELPLVRKAVAMNKAVLGVCLGIQVINIALGGKIHQDVPDGFKDSETRHRKKTGCSFTEHSVTIAADSLLRRIIGKDEVIVNSSHHQAVSVPAPGLRSVAWAPDGVIEAIESSGDTHILGVQWHPEYLTDREEHFNLFRWVVDPSTFYLQ